MLWVVIRVDPNIPNLQTKLFLSENKIDGDTFILLDNNLVKELIKTIGDRARFLKKLELWKTVINDDDNVKISDVTGKVRLLS